MSKRLVLLVIASVLALGPATAVLADGCYIPSKAVMKIPDIPGQRAVIAHSNGIETLIISSALDSEAQELGWIIPLPNSPTQMEKVSPGSLKTLGFCLQPEITHDLSQQAGTLAFVTIIGLLLLATLLFRRERFVTLLVVLLLLLFLSSLLLPAMARAGARATAGAAAVHVERTARVGAYDIAVLRAKKHGDLNAWLSGNGFAELPKKAVTIVSDYIADNWVFVAIKLAREEAGLNAPHPIKLVFDADEVVYPLKLTALPGGETFFELFVLADSRVSNAALDTEFCDRFSTSREQRYRPEDYETKSYYRGQDTELAVGHPEICEVMWDGCVLTKLSGSIAAEDMTDDMRFTPHDYAPYRQHFFSQVGARLVGAMVFISLLGVFCFVTFIAYRDQLRETRGTLRYMGRVLAPAMVVFLLVAALAYICLPKITTDRTHVTVSFFQYHFPMELQHSILRILEDKPDVLENTEKDLGKRLLTELANWNDRYADEGMPNRISGGTVKIEDTPGNFTLERTTNGLAIRVYDHVGRPMILEYPPAPKDKD